MSSLQNLKQNLKIHSVMDDEVTLLKNRLLDLKKRKNSLEETIINDIRQLELENKKLNLENTTYILSNSKISPAITLDMIHDICLPIIGNSSTLLVLSKIKEYKTRNKKIVPNLKRRKKKTINRNINKCIGVSKKNGINREMTYSSHVSLKKNIKN